MISIFKLYIFNFIKLKTIKFKKYILNKIKKKIKKKIKRFKYLNI